TFSPEGPLSRTRVAVVPSANVNGTSKRDRVCITSILCSTSFGSADMPSRKSPGATYASWPTSASPFLSPAFLAWTLTTRVTSSIGNLSDPQNWISIRWLRAAPGEWSGRMVIETANPRTGNSTSTANTVDGSPPVGDGSVTVRQYAFPIDSLP